MQVRRSEPDAVEWAICIPKCLAEMAKALITVLGEDHVLIDRDIVRVRIEPMAVRADILDRHDFAGIFAAKILAVGGMIPAPMAALRLRSSKETLLPSQWRFIFSASRWPWFQIDGKSVVPMRSR